MWFKILITGLIVLAFLSCAKKEGEGDKLPDEVRRGREIFYDVNYGTTELACANCHADFDDVKFPDGKIRPGHNLIGAHSRKIAWYGRFRGEALVRTAGGAGLCVVMYQRKTGSKNPLNALPVEDANALMSYFKFISGEVEVEKLTSQPLVLPWEDESKRKEKLEIVKRRILNLQGNQENGEIIYERACDQCHSEDIAIGPPLFTVKITPEKIIEMVRLGSPSTSETPMPFFTPDKLTDQQVADLIAFLMKFF